MRSHRRAYIDLKVAIEHLLWISKKQPPGFLLIRTLSENEDGTKRPKDEQFFDNKDPELDKKVERFLKKISRRKLHVYYAVNSFKTRSAKAENVISSRLAHVDADKVALPPTGPKPTRIIKTSTGNYQFIYELDEEVLRAEIESISKHLTGLVGGDKGGHSAAKLLRLPGTLNVKTEYERPPNVRVIRRGPVHSAQDLLVDASEASPETTVPQLHGVEALAKTYDAKSILQDYRSMLPPDIRIRLRQRGPYRSFSIRMDGETLSSYPGDDCSEICWVIACAFRDAGASPEEALAVTMDSCFWRDRESRNKGEDPERFISKVVAHEVADEPTVISEELFSVDPADWFGLTVPERKWLVRDLIPMGKVTGLYGDGGTGKTTLALQLGVAVALSEEFLDLETKAGSVYAFLAEDDQDDSHISLDAICRHYGSNLSELRGRMWIAPRAGFDNILMAFVSGGAKHTKLFDRLLEDIKRFSLALVILDTAADVFGGNENARSEVRQFIQDCCGRIARETGAAVLLCAHPSRAGLSSGEGFGGSTAWENTMRSRLYLDRPKNGDVDQRVLGLKKSNYAKADMTVDLRWKGGAFIVQEKISASTGPTEQEQLIIQEVKRAFAAGHAWNANHQATLRYIGDWIKDELRIQKNMARDIIRKLLGKKLIVELKYDLHGNKKGLCTPEQAKQHKKTQKVARERSAKQRNNRR